MNQRQIVYILLWLPVSFSAVIAITKLFAAIFNSNSVPMLGQGIAFLSLVIAGTAVILNQTGTDQDRDEEPAEDSPGPNVEPQSRTYSPGHNSETDNSDPDSDSTDDSHSDSGRSDTDSDSGRQSSLRQSNDAIVDETEDQLRDYLTFYDDGTIRIENDDQFNMYSRMMLYVLAKRLAHEDGLVDTPNVTGKELRDRFLYTCIDLMLFLDEAENMLTPSYSIGYRTGNIDYAELDNIEITVELRKLGDITDWTVNEEQDTRYSLDAQIGAALAELDEAQSQYEYGNPEQIRRYVKSACADVQQYPVEIGYDNHWKSFSRHADTILNYLERGEPGKTTHCVPRMEGALNTMREQVQAESLLDTALERHES